MAELAAIINFALGLGAINTAAWLLPTAMAVLWKWHEPRVGYLASAIDAPPPVRGLALHALVGCAPQWLASVPRAP